MQIPVTMSVPVEARAMSSIVRRAGRRPPDAPHRTVL